MSISDHVIYAASDPSFMLLAQGGSDGPVGPEFGKASPIGLLILAIMGVFVIMAGGFFHRRYSRFRRRTLFAEAHGIDPFDKETLDAAMAEAGVLDRRKSSKF
ncbi:hypothetical protein ACEE23_03400 [Corynebacterium sp. 32222D000AT]